MIAIDWELGGRDSQTFGKMASKDHWEAYSSELEGHHIETKTETRNIERNNSNSRHWFARFRRKSKVVSRSKEMV